VTERQAFIVYFIGVLLVEMIVLCGLKLLGADSETIASAFGLLLSGAGLGVGFLGAHYH
jgi:hypothetical protein